MFRFTTIATLALVAAAPATAGTVLAYDTVNGAIASAAVEGNTVTGADLVRGSGITQNAGGDFNSRGWTGSSFVDAAIDSDYLEWGFSSGLDYTLQKLDIAYDRSPTGPTFVSLYADVNGAGYAEIFMDTMIDVNSEMNSIDLTMSLVDFSSANDVTFRLFGWGATTNAGTFDIETGEVGYNNQFGISILGVVPLPAGLPMLAGGLALLGLVRRKA